MWTLLAWPVGAISLLAGIVLAVIAIGQLAYGVGGAFVLPAAAAAAAWACSRQVQSAQAAELERLGARPEPLTVPDGELVLHMRWGKWLSATLFLAGFASFAIHALAAPGGAPEFWTLVELTFGVVVLVPATLLLLETARRALDLGGVARLDAQGFRHCLLPAIPWGQVRGVDLESRLVRGARQWFLALAVDRELAPALRLAWWWRLLGTSVPRAHDDGRLAVPLAYVHGEPRDVVGQAMSVADRWGAPRSPDWRPGRDPESKRLIAEAERSIETTNRSMEDMHRMIEEQMKPNRSGASQ